MNRVSVVMLIRQIRTCHQYSTELFVLNMCKWTWACAVVIGLGPWCVDEARGTAAHDPRPTAMH